MTAAQSLKIYEILGRHFNNTEDARIVVTEIEEIIETKLAEKTDILSTKEDLMKLELSTKEDILKLRVDIEKRFNQLTIWVVGVAIGLGGLIIAVTKL